LFPGKVPKTALFNQVQRFQTSLVLGKWFSFSVEGRFTHSFTLALKDIKYPCAISSVSSWHKLYLQIGFRWTYYNASLNNRAIQFWENSYGCPLNRFLEKKENLRSNISKSWTILA
jgi:hypothetical protein